MWFESAVVYQIYPLGACDCPFENDGNLVHRLDRVQEWIVPLKQLGIDTVLLNPVFESHTHGYDTIDHYHVDVRLGDNQDLRNLTQAFHDQGIHVLFDAVFNHVGRGFFAFQDVLKNRESSPYRDWFFIDFFGNNSYDDHFSYQNWEGNENLVKLNLYNDEVRKYIFDVVQYWMYEFGCDGLRLDVAYCLDLNFLEQLHTFVKEKRSDFFLLGETLHGDYNRWVNDKMLDSCTNYECYKGLYSSLNSYNLFEILHSFHRQFGNDNWCLYRGKHLLNFVDNHDVTRIGSQLQNPFHLPLIYVLLFTMPGIPCLYYGSEWGMTGQKNWNDTSLRPAIEKLQHNSLTDWIKQLIFIHHHYSSLVNGEYQQVYLTNTACAYLRKNKDEEILTILNISDQIVFIPVPWDGGYDLLTMKPFLACDQIQIPGNSAYILSKHITQ